MLSLLYFISFISLLSATGCLHGLPAIDYLTTMAEEIITNTNYSVTDATQYIFTPAEFNCSGAIIGWASLALDGQGRGRPEISIWTPSQDHSTYTKRAGVLIDDCTRAEDQEVVEGSAVFLHQGRMTELLRFQQGDVLGLLLRQERSSDYTPLLVEEDDSTGFSYGRSGPYMINHTLSQGTTTNKLPLLSLQLCVDSAESNVTYSNCSAIMLPSTTCPPEEIASSSAALTSSSSSALPTWTLIVIVTVPCVLVLVVLVIVLGVCIVWHVRSDTKYKVDSSPHQPPTTLPMTPCDTPCPLNGDASHTYETPLRPSVTISCDGDENSDAVIVNHTRSSSNAEASVYEEPLVSVQYDSIFGEQHQHVYDALMSPESSQPPVFSRHNSPHLVPTLPSHSHTMTGPPYYHTLEKSLRSSSPSPPQHRANRPSKGTSPLVASHSRGASYDAGDGVEQGSSQDSLQLPPVGYQIITTHSSLKLNSGVTISPSQQQRSQLSQEPIFDDNIYACLRNAPNSPLVHNWSFFVETEHYWKPSSDKVQLYHQLHMKKYREINHKQIQITEHLGAGEFGTVCKGFWHTSSGSLEVAIKMAQNQASEVDKVRFLQEAAILGQFQHPNIVQLHGVVTVNDPVMILLELMKKGDLNNYLRTLQPVPGELVQPELPYKLLRFCTEVALGLEYLAKKSFVHRDIAARNILLTENYTCKIGDFGMSRDLDDQEYYLSNGGMIPFKWTSPEALHYRKYSSASDVWSYGVLLWEIWSLGRTPYSDCQAPDEATAKISSGARLLPPPGCPRAIYKLMMESWNPKPSKRPTFTDIVRALHEPSTQILHWSEDQSSQKASCLGASMEAGHQLYPDLQIMYSKMSV